MNSAALSFDALQEAVEKLPDGRLAASRRAALEHLRQHGLPTTRDEDWKYTDLSSLVDIGNQSIECDSDRSRSPELERQIESIKRSIEADWLVIANGLIDDRSVRAFDNANVSVSRLSDSDAELEYRAPLSDLNTALLHDGLHIHINANAGLKRPIGILFIDDATIAAGMSQARVEIAMADNSDASIIECHSSLGSARHYANSVVKLVLGSGARSNYVRIQERSQHHDQTGRLSVDVGRDSEFNHCAFDLGGGLIRNDLSIDIAKPGGRTAFDGLYLIGDRQHVDNHTRADHRVGPAESQQEYRGILTGHSRGVWNGKAIVHAGADGTDAAQANHNLLLSDKAEIDAKPELEIYADDVKCSHGTTIGQLDEAALFYLRTRGLSRHDAKQILTRAFAQAIVSKSPIDAIHGVLSEKIAARLGELMGGATM
ncbi:MAG: Fe-S cluster assembly protein SufD [Gammaproteobacteria bacterium]|nr:Fe-S cluster assembly protein SufD [Gammaproteobacteria bacterium]MDH3429985.1 Fe-S cluster assembly protein SufD [Gammaproteobacteria bacterium]MDH3434925.1 Fe-S cluster assembly protein SufD [Gammaproteobacteria bacterium]